MVATYSRDDLRAGRADWIANFTLATAVASRCAQATGWPYFRMGTLQGAEGSGRMLAESRSRAA